MITPKAVGGPAYPENFEEMDKELTKLIEDFNHAVEALRLAKKNGKHFILFSYLMVIRSQCVCSAGTRPSMG